MKNEPHDSKVDGGAAAPRPHIFIGLPIGNHQVEAELATFLSRVGAGHPKYRFTLRTVQGVSPVAFARNLLAKDFFLSGADRLWMLDADIVPGADLFGLLEVEGDIVAAGCPVGDFGENLFLNGFIETPQGYRPASLHGGTQEVDAVGFAAVLLSRKVMEDPAMRLPGFEVSRPWRGDTYKPVAPGLFREVYGADGSVVVTEDIDFCIRAKAAGYKPIFAPAFMVGHRKRGNLLGVIEGMYGAYEKGRLEGEADAAFVAQASERRIILP